MKKRILITLVLALVGALALSFAAAASCGKCPGDKAAAGKHECKSHASKEAACKGKAACEESFKALEADLVKMDAEMNAADQASFLKAHKENLKKFITAKKECEKACKAAAGAEKEHACKPGCTKPCCAKGEAKETAKAS